MLRSMQREGVSDEMEFAPLSAEDVERIGEVDRTEHIQLAKLLR